MASTDAKPFPQKNVAYRVTFPIFDADGDLVTGATGLDSEISKDGGTFADCTNEATEIATSSGIYYLDLTSTEMNADTVAIIVKTSSSGAKTTPLVMYPEEAGDIRVNATQLNGTGLTGRDIGASVLLSPGTATGQLDITSGVVKANLAQILGTALTETAGQIAAGFKKLFDVASPVFTLTSVNQTGDAYARLGAPAGASVSADVAAVKAVLPAALVSGRIDASVGAMATGVLTATAIAADAITDAKVASDVTIASVTGAVGSVTGNVGGNVTGSVGSVATGGITAASIAADAIGASELATDAVTEIAAGVWDRLTNALTTVGSAGKLLVDNLNATVSSRASQTSLDTVDDFLDTEVAAIKAKTDNLPSDPADASDIASAFTTVNGKLDTIDDFLDTEVSAIKAKTDLIPAAPAAVGDIPTAAAIADAVHDEVVEGTTTLRQSIRLANAALGGKASGLDTTTVAYRDLADSKDRFTATVDANGNRSAVTRDLT